MGWRTEARFGLISRTAIGPGRPVSLTGDWIGQNVARLVYGAHVIGGATLAMTGPAPTVRSEITIAVARLRLFVSSYAPAFVIFAVRFNGLALRICCGAVALVGIVDSATMMRRAVRKSLPYEIAISSVEDVGGEVSGYLASYLLPFVTVSSPSARDLVGYGIFLLIAAIVYVRSDLVRVNPTLYLFGYRVLAVTFGERGQQYLITRRSPRQGMHVSVVDVAGVLLATGGDVAR